MDIKDLLFYARIKQIQFENFRNIEEGVIEFPNSKLGDYLDGNPSIVGLYGQNGSGKSSVIMALSILKDLLSGESIGKKYLSSVRNGCDKCKLTFTFAMYNKLIDSDGTIINTKENTTCYDVYYEVEILRDVEEVDDNTNGSDSHQEVLRIGYETLKYRITDYTGKILLPKQTIIDTTKQNRRKKSFVFGSEQKEQLFTADDEAIAQQYRDNLAVTAAQSQSFIFSFKTQKLLEQAVNAVFDVFDEEDFEFYKVLETSPNLPEAQNNLRTILINNEDALMMHSLVVYLTNPCYLIKNLRTFGRVYLHVIDTVITGQTNINTQMPLLLWWHDQKKGVYFRRISLQMDGPTAVKQSDFDVVKRSLAAVSDVLEKIVPGMRLAFVDLGVRLASDNSEEHYFEITSQKGETCIPLKYESDGVRRIVSILSLLIAAYNDTSFTIAIDEIDSGIFEYLLGEILAVMADSIKGQLVFTSHNLRPLEILPTKYLYFTTTNPEKRFLKIPNRGNSNLRDTYFRSIVLDTQKEQVYNPTDRYEMELAFYKAGHNEVN